MWLLRGVQNVSVLQTETVATVGNFDGLHAGHQALLTALKEKANRLNLPTLVILFEPQPCEYFQERAAPSRLTNFREKFKLFKAFDIQYICCIRFNAFIAAMSASDFASQIIFSKLRVHTLLVGQDFRFGKDRLGDAHLLKDIANRMHKNTSIYSDFLLNNIRVSSTQIRAMLKQGYLKEAQLLLGRPFSLCGRVVKGDQLGRQFGVPTANIKLARLSLPLSGVFCVHVKRENGILYPGIANIGQRPTVCGKVNRLEVHLLNFNGVLYHEHLEVFFLHRLREEVKFPSIDMLIQQMNQDIIKARMYFARLIEELPIE